MRIHSSPLSIALVVLGGLALAYQAPISAQDEGKVPARAIVLTHVAGADRSSWSKVILLLQDAGYRAVSVQSLLSSLTASEADVRPALDVQDGQSVLVGPDRHVDTESKMTADLFGFLAAEPGAEIGAVYSGAMPAILTDLDEWDIWLPAPWGRASIPQRLLPAAHSRWLPRAAVRTRPGRQGTERPPSPRQG
ncbi:hypothetical protein [Roseomonas marmotae]|uniref:ThuA-like domain-containing protein n=1 Tax=Roseomonas marmotae TaxID=2768161 RepID=A0ABS3KI21_9PROT|nr:hypothetical protein [Roseomonas marmotae]MBO1077123.1 hypothetical protein [Roseomonas marmotae]QTI81161.1 hypothetical protein IAI58_17565 [Roseomonas marmotae]